MMKIIYNCSIEFIKKYIIFESDNLEDCYNFIESLQNSKKYNL